MGRSESPIRNCKMSRNLLIVGSTCVRWWRVNGNFRVRKQYFSSLLGVVVVGLWRKEGWLHGELAEMPLQEGDLLVLWDRQQNYEQLAAHHGFLMLMPFDG